MTLSGLGFGGHGATGFFGHHGGAGGIGRSGKGGDGGAAGFALGGGVANGTGATFVSSSAIDFFANQANGGLGGSWR